MLNCVVDGMGRTLEVSGRQNLGHVISSLNREIEANGKVVASMRVNGEEFIGDVDDLAMNCDGVHSIEITTDTPENLAMSALAGSCQYVEELREFILKTVDLFRIGDEKKGREFFLETVQGLQWMIRMLGCAGTLLGVDFSRAEHEGRAIDGHIGRLNRIFSEIVAAQEKDDLVLLIDLLEYELGPQLALWKRVFEGLRAGVMKQAA